MALILIQNNKSYFVGKIRSEFSDKELSDAKLKQHKINECKTILKEVFLNFTFLWALYIVCYSTTNKNAYNYQFLQQNNFNQYQDV